MSEAHATTQGGGPIEDQADHLDERPQVATFGDNFDRQSDSHSLGSGGIATGSPGEAAQPKGDHHPSVSAIVSDDGLAQVLIDGIAHPVSGATVSASRENVVRFIAARVASELGCAIRVDVADPEGQLVLMIYPDATVQVLPPQDKHQESLGPDSSLQELQQDLGQESSPQESSPRESPPPESGSPESGPPESQRQHSRRADRRRAAEATPEVAVLLPNQTDSGEFAPRDATTEEFAAVVDAVMASGDSLIGHSDVEAHIDVAQPIANPAQTRPASSLALSALKPLAAPRPVAAPAIQIPVTETPQALSTAIELPPSKTASTVPAEPQTAGTAAVGAASATPDRPIELFTHAGTSHDSDTGNDESTAAEKVDRQFVAAPNITQRSITQHPTSDSPANGGPPGGQRSFPLGFSPVPEPGAAAFPIAPNVLPDASPPPPDPLLKSGHGESSAPFAPPRQPTVGHHAAPAPAPAPPASPATTAIPAPAAPVTAVTAPAPAPSTQPPTSSVPESLPTLDSLLAARPASVGGPAQMGWQGAVRRITGGIISPKAGPTEVTHREAVASVQRSLRGPRTVVVVNPKGGAHKTTAALLIAATFGIHRGGYTLAWDNNETRGTLGWRAAQTRHTNTAVDLLRDLERFEDARSARVGDLDNYVRTQGNAQFDVLASDEDAASAASIDGDAFLALHSSLSRFYRILVVDTGNNMRASNWQAAVNKADQLVIVSTIREDTAQSAAWLLDGLRASGQEEAVANAVTVLSAPAKNIDRELSARLHTHFGKLTRAVLDVPHDPALVAGGPVNVETLAGSTRESWLHVTAAVAEGL